MLRLRRARLRIGVLQRLRDAGAEPDAGFSLIEVIVAITILTIISLFSAQLVQISIRSSDDLNKYQTAVSLATMQMEGVRGADTLFDPVMGTTRLFRGRPKTEQLNQFDTAHNTAAAYVADVLANTYPEWDPNTPDSAIAANNAIIAPTGVDTTVECSATLVNGQCPAGQAVYRDANKNQVYPISGNPVDSFGTRIWSRTADGSQRIQEVYTATGGTCNGQPEYKSASGVQLCTAVTPTGGQITQSTVVGYPSGQITLNGTQYTTTIIVGSCFVDTSVTALRGSQNGKCTANTPALTSALTSAGYTNITSRAATSLALPANLSGYAKLVRAIVVVQWTGGADCSVQKPCSYALTSEFLPDGPDLKWRVGL